ncbi:MAG TPA: NAD-dependent succinate-semialdehyde dehydrogenase [Sphingobium sp.]
MQYQDVLLHIDGRWRPALSGKTIPIINPATEEVIGTVAHAEKADLDEALAAAQKGFRIWREVAPFDRAKLMRKAADLLRERVEAIAPLVVQEQGKPLYEARMEVMTAADVTDWLAGEGQRTYGRVIPARLPGVYQLSLREPVGPVAAFTPWNNPINQVVRKLASALATGCSIIIKAPEETPASPAQLVQAFVDAGIPAGVINLVYGIPAEISEYLIPHPVIKKISFTGSTVVGKHIASLAGQHMKRATMELGGHAPALVFDDADVAKAATTLAALKYRNAGQVCVSPTRFLVQEKVYDAFVDRFVTEAKAIKVGYGLEDDVRMGPLANVRRLDALETLVQDAVAKGATLATGGRRIANKGYYFEPTVITDVPGTARAMNEEPFGPLALIAPFASLEEAVAEANRLPFGLAAYAFTQSSATATMLSHAVESGMVAINGAPLALPEVPFSGIKDSGYGSEGGTEALEGYLNIKYVTHAAI